MEEDDQTIDIGDPEDEMVNVTVEDFDEECPVWQLFVEAAGEDMEIDWEELQRILNTCFEQGKGL